MPIPVSVITGFLGAGKSTLVEAWLEDLPRDQTAVIINERGQVGIDGALLAGRVPRLREITGGCVCCTTQAALDAALREFAEGAPPPTRILVETSGVASPAGVIRALTHGTARERLRLDGIVTVLDASRSARALEFDLTVEQLGFADVVVMSHADQCTHAQLEELEARVGSYAPGAVVTRAIRGRPEGPSGRSMLELLDARSGVLRVVPSAHGTTPRHGIDAVCLVHEGELHEGRFGDWVERALGAVEARILRVKGILAVQGVDERVVVQGVGEAIEVSLGVRWTAGHRSSRLVVLGLGLDAEALRTGFLACAV